MYMDLKPQIKTARTSTQQVERKTCKKITETPNDNAATIKPMPQSPIGVKAVAPSIPLLPLPIKTASLEGNQNLARLIL